MAIELDVSRTRHHILPATGHCYNCGNRLQPHSGNTYHCSQACASERPLKMAAAELSWGEPADRLAHRWLNEGRSVEAVAGMLGVHKQALYTWLRRWGIERRVQWVRRGDAP